MRIIDLLKMIEEHDLDISRHDILFETDNGTFEHFEIVLGTHEYPDGSVTTADDTSKTDPPRALPRPVLVIRETLQSEPRRPVTCSETKQPS